MNPAQSRTKPQFDIIGWLRQWRRPETWVAYLFIVPSLIGFLVFFAIPAVRGPICARMGETKRERKLEWMAASQSGAIWAPV